VNEILSVGLILLAALVAGKAAQLARTPEVTGYVLMGIVVGPAGVDVISTENVEALRFLSEVALGMILFSIGTIFEAGAFRQVGRRVVLVTLAEAGAAFVLVGAGLLWLGLPFGVVLLLSVVAMETAPATTLMVLHEYNARGPLTETVTALLALNNMLVLVAFGVVSAVLAFLTPGGPPDGTLSLLYSSLFGLLWGIFGSIAFGAALGLALETWLGRVQESGEVMILAIGIVLVGVGGARWLELSSLFVTLALGATLVNASHRSDELVDALRRADPPMYAAFFVLAGAELRPEILATIGAAGTLYVVLRVAGKTVGAWLAARRLAFSRPVRQHLGLCILSSSSLAIGITIQIRNQFPDLAVTVTGIVLAAVVIFEIVGPLLARYALVRTGEAQVRPTLIQTPALPAEPGP
jgi:Kef-type K+ transport system membrane component KefB